ncbi:putative soluble epoxide hydrolase [Helianthus annuus]|nr:putative soluble epoxide hydrolase [Helianthus annuus]KAJ0646744.1 putative soluble epoxide hydrolase [Helianthus annuus]KAJ0838217.1 putative soluble epoxide hydrolase [Helianthus annuus]
MESVIDLTHHRIKTNGIHLHVAEKKGPGPFLLLLHGFPETWFSWHHQIRDLATHGCHVVAPDLRGYGDSDSPSSPSSYTMFHIVADLIGLLDHFNQQQVFVVGHDWGATVAWHLSLFRPDRVKGMVALCVPFFPRDPHTKPTHFFKQSFGDNLYVSQFQEPGRAERAFAKYDCLTVIKKFLLTDKTDVMIAPPGMEIIDDLEIPSQLPPWITEEELQIYADKFQESGFTGGLNYYRAMDLTWELLAPWQGSKITVPSKFIIGDKDIGYKTFSKPYIEGNVMKTLVPDIEVVIVDGGHHFIQHEKPQEVCDEIISFIQKLAKN